MDFHFEDYALDVARRELRRGSELVPLEPQVFDLLVYVIRNRDRVVTKDDLIEAVWGGRIVSDSTLTTRINAMRRVLGDSGEEQRLAGDTERQASSGEVKDLRREMGALKELVADLTIENRLLKKSAFGDGGDPA